MKQKKHIDRLFQEGLKNFEATPSDAVWNRIEANLNKQQKRRVIPIWWRFAGAAAILLLGLFMGINYFKTPESIQVVDTKQDVSAPYSTTEDNTTTRGYQTTKQQTKDSNLNNNLITEKENNALANNKSKNSSNKQQANTSYTSTNNKKINTNVAQGNMDKNQKQKLATKSNVNSSTEQTLLANNKANKQPVNANKNKKEQPTAINQQLAANKKESPSIEQAIAENTEVAKIKKTKITRWSIAPNVAPVYYNSLSKGSPIDDQFKNNSKTGEINMSYGINASYAVNKKIRVRTGISKVSLGYNTNNVVVFESVSAKTSSLKNINLAPGSKFGQISAISSENLSTTNKGPRSFLNTSINQSLDFIEVPLEIEYSLLDKKLGINIIGGFSSFFLNDNQVFSQFDGGNKTLIGQANNINDVSYSANLGLGLNYSVSKKIDFNLEPMFKYQINTFENTSGNFKPYFVGVYTGVAIKF